MAQRPQERPSGIPLPFRLTSEIILAPGDSYEDAKGNPLSGEDACEIYVLLEQWTGEGDNLKKLRVATAWHRSSDVISDWTDLNLDFTYGELDNPRDFEIPADGYAEEGTTPTHITVVFSSSALGDDFVGAIGSVLEVDDFQLVY